MSQYTINDSPNCFNTSNSINVRNYLTISDDRSQLLTWLSPREPTLRHREVRESRVDDVGEWFLRTEEFKKWRGLSREGEGQKAVLFCYGNPGVGKTFISSLVIDRLCSHSRGQNAVITCFYFDFAARKEQSATSVLGSLVKQVVRGMERIPDEISRAFQEEKKAMGGCGPQLADLMKMLQAIMSSQLTYICIDALDECVATQRSKLFDSFKEILERCPGTRIFVSGRPHIRAEIEKRLAACVASISIGATRDDIVGFLRVRLSQDETPDAMNASLEKEILQRIPENISEMFLLVSLTIDSVLQESTIYQRRERLRKMTDGLGLEDVYGATIERIKAQGRGKSRLGMAALMWISHAERPLRADELCHALAVERGSADFNADNIPSTSTLLTCCQGLITMDKEALTVRLIHFTLKEYLSTCPDIICRPHMEMAEICLTYLSSQQIKTLSADPSPHVLDTPFLGYCSLYWGAHAKKELSDHARSLALSLLQEYDSHISAKALLEQVMHTSHEDLGASFRFSGLHCISFFGIVGMLAALIETGPSDINQGDRWGYTPLAWAARNGHGETVKVLLAREEINPDKPNRWGETPLLHASYEGHEAVINILLERYDVSPDNPDHWGKTPLLQAARKGHEEVVKILLGRREVNPNTPDNRGNTPLSVSTQGGHEHVVNILLRRAGLNADMPDNGGRTPIWYAAGGGYEKVVKILLGREEVNPDKPDDNGNTPLSISAQGGHENVVEILLGRPEVNPDKPDNVGRTPLWYAAGGGYEKVVNILLGREEVDPDRPDHDGRTPLSFAAWGGLEGVVKILLRREEIKPEKTDNRGRTPLWYAAGGGYGHVVEILLTEEEVNPDSPDDNGDTPLSIATFEGHTGVVKVLLGPGAVNPNKPNHAGRTPLSHAAQNGHREVVQILLGQHEVNPDHKDKYGNTPLASAAYSGCEEVVKILLGQEGVNPDNPTNAGQTPLSYAAWQGHERVVQILLEEEEVNPNKADSDGDTPLSCAVRRGHERVVQILLRREEVIHNKADNGGQTPLMHAVRQGCQRVIEQLENHEAVARGALSNRGEATP